MTDGGVRAVVLAALVLAPACRCKDEAAKEPAQARRATPAAKVASRVAPAALLLGDVEVALVDGEGKALPVDALTAKLRERLLGSGLFAGAAPATPTPAGDGAPAPTVRVQLTGGAEGARVGAKGVVHAALRLRVDTRPASTPGAVADDVAGRGEMPFVASGAGATTADQAAATLMLRLAGDLLDGVLARARLERGPDDGVLAILEAAAKDLATADAGLEVPPLLLPAIAQAGARTLRPAASALLALLGHDDEEIRDAALGALVALREQRTIKVLNRLRSPSDGRELRKIIDAVGEIGGEDAIAYLEFLADGHRDPEIRDMAKAARQRLDRDGGAAR